ncbi:2-hydroxyacid dehydrogenase [Limnochorda pilosa]|uniref:Glyoxylate reductase n=1 Tax=Limnochorda pilosa TaxID=1555112 RepID=A0A0K2SIL6_LIMPI|nr:D-glycerate dehydrogenase [Limnochorda pilosa]BAS26935.1 glyoxylate reductase [Limnochorda pilosa]
MSRVFITQRIYPEGVRILEQAGIPHQMRPDENPLPTADLIEQARGVEALITLVTDRIAEDVFQALPELRIVANVAVGYDNIDLSAATRHGVVVTNTPDVLTEATADMAFALMLAAARRIPEADRFVREGRWHGWTLMQEQMGVDLYGRTLGIFGMGRIGAAMARRAHHGFGMRILYTNRSAAPAGLEQELQAERVPFERLLSESDFVSIHAPATPETRHVFTADAFRRMKPTAILVNTARGPLVDEAALVNALRSGEIAGAGLDVFEEEPQVHPGLLELTERVALAPHLGSATLETRTRMCVMAAENVREFLQGRRPANAVNPEVLAG